MTDFGKNVKGKLEISEEFYYAVLEGPQKMQLEYSRTKKSELSFLFDKYYDQSKLDLCIYP